MGNHRKFFVGDIYEVPDGKFVVEELDLNTYKHATVRWLTTGNFQRIRLDVIKLGNIKNPMHPSVEGIGFIGVGDRLPYHDKDRYNSWASMIARCYRTKLHEKYPTYEECQCVDGWLNFQNFCEFYDDDKFRKKGWNLDKDLLILGNKVYSPETCVFLPKALNNIALSYVDTTSKFGYKGVGYCPESGKWISSVWSPTTLNNKTTGGRYLDIRDACRDHLRGNIRRYENIISEYEGILDPRAIEAYKVRIKLTEQEIEEVN